MEWEGAVRVQDCEPQRGYSIGRGVGRREGATTRDRVRSDFISRVGGRSGGGHRLARGLIGTLFNNTVLGVLGFDR